MLFKNSLRLCVILSKRESLIRVLFTLILIPTKKKTINHHSHIETTCRTANKGASRGGLPYIDFLSTSGIPSSAFGAALLQGPTRWGLSDICFHAADCLLFAFSFRKVFVGAPEAFLEGDLRLPLEIAFRFGVVQGGAVDVALSGFIVGGNDLFT